MLIRQKGEGRPKKTRLEQGLQGRRQARKGMEGRQVRERHPIKGQAGASRRLDLHRGRGEGCGPEVSPPRVHGAPPGTVGAN